MATYIQGQTDYISQIQPTEPNLAFDAQMLQAKQSKYDANHKKVSELYGSLLNSAMTRTDNIQARDEFFKIINDDIKRMGGLDFSLDQNVQAAASVFQSIYTNNNIVKDMVWTKNFNNQLNRANAFKNCLDEEKCGGIHWDEGERYLEYKRNEFKNANAGEAMGMADPEYVPYKSVMKQAIKLAKDAGLNVEIDSLNGGYVVTTKNGILLKTPLADLFSSTIGADPNFIKQFKIESFVKRNDWVNNKLAMGEFDNQTDAQLGYLRDIDRINKIKIENAADELGTTEGYLDDKINEMQLAYQNGDFKEGSEEYNKLNGLLQLQGQVKSSKQYIDQVNSISVLENKNAALDVLTDAIDEQSGLAALLDQINLAATTLANKDSKVSFKADEFAKMAQEHQYNMSEIAVKHRNAIELENIEFEQKKEFAQFEKSIGSSKYSDGPTSAQAAILSQEIEQLNNEIEIFDPEEKAAAEFKKNNSSSASVAEINNWKNSSNASDQAKYKKYEKELEKQKAKLENKKIDVNKRNIKKGEEPQYPELLNKETLQQVENKKPGYIDDWADKIKLEFKQKYPKLTDEIFDEAYESADTNYELYSYLDGYFQTNIK
jgi:hypothetical protein